LIESLGQRSQAGSTVVFRSTGGKSCSRPATIAGRDCEWARDRSS
jgi:hypothetical protein